MALHALHEALERAFVGPKLVREELAVRQHQGPLAELVTEPRHESRIPLHDGADHLGRGQLHDPYRASATPARQTGETRNRVAGQSQLGSQNAKTPDGRHDTMNGVEIRGSEPIAKRWEKSHVLEFGRSYRVSERDSRRSVRMFE